MIPDLAKLLQASGIAALLSEVLFIHGPSALQEFMLGRVKVPDPAAESVLTPKVEDHPNALQLYPELALAVQPVNGVIFPGVSASREEWGGYFNTDRIRKTCEEVAGNSAVNTLVLLLDTPGGAARGLHPAAEALLALPQQRRGLQVVSFVPRLCASAGYYLAAATQQIHATPSAVVGSIGTIASLDDSTAFWEKIGIKSHLFTDGALKGMGHARFGVSEEQKKWMAAEVSAISAEFKGLVKERRKGIKDGDMQGQIFEARRAPAALLDSARHPSLEHFLAEALAV